MRYGAKDDPRSARQATAEECSRRAPGCERERADQNKSPIPAYCDRRLFGLTQTNTRRAGMFRGSLQSAQFNHKVGTDSVETLSAVRSVRTCAEAG